MKLTLHMPDHPIGQPRRFDVKDERAHSSAQFSGDRAVLEIGTFACTLGVYAPALGRTVSVEVAAGFEALALDVDF